MKLITRDTDYAIRALCYIAKNKNEIISVRELVTKLKIPRPFLRKGQFKLSECLFKKEVCPNTKICALRRKIDNIEKYVIKELKSVSIAYLLRQGTNGYGKKKDYKY
ncbi:MAG: hypothetical protein NTW64_03570 [Candidatus Omnitrophica bacterium]|nr:hypothetical protein [Candidatus Omnitrophota bacterium]